MKAEGGGEVRGPRLCGVPSERGFVFLGGFPGLHPGLVCDAPLGQGVRNVVLDKLQWNRANPLERDARFGRGYGIGNVIVPFALQGHGIGKAVVGWLPRSRLPRREDMPVGARARDRNAIV